MASKKSSEVIAEPGNLAARLDPGYTEIVAKQEGRPDIRIRLRPLTYLQRVFCDSVKARGALVDREAQRVEYTPESIAEYVQWVLRLGIESVEGIAWNTEATRVTGRTAMLVKLECLDALPDALQDAAFGQVLQLSELSYTEKVKLDFTSPLRGEVSPDATA